MALQTSAGMGQKLNAMYCEIIAQWLHGALSQQEATERVAKLQEIARATNTMCSIWSRG